MSSKSSSAAVAPESHGALATDTTGSGVAMPKMHPLWLHFHDPSLEASFQSWHGTTWPNQAFEIIDLLLVSTFTLVPLILFTQWRLGNPLSYRPLLFVVPILVRFFFKTRPHLSQVLRWTIRLLPCISVIFTASETIWFNHPIPLLLLPLPRLIISTCSLKSWREYLLGCTVDWIVFVSLFFAFNKIEVARLILRQAIGFTVFSTFAVHHVESSHRSRWFFSHNLERALASEHSARLNAERMIGFLSHEVRNPQAAMSMSIDCLLHDAQRDPALLSADHVRVIEGLRANSDSVTALLEDVLNMQRIAQGLLKIEKAPFALRDFVQQLESNFSHLLQKKNHDFIVSLDPRLPTAVLGDRHRIRQILSNFISNAVKFTPEDGSIELVVAVVEAPTASESASTCPMACDSTFAGTLPSLRLNAASALKVATPEFSKSLSVSCLSDSAASSQAMWIQFSIRDTGIGISADDEEKLFQAYSQIQAGLNQSGGGAGLGLNICKGLADLQGGSIGVCSLLHAGSEFFIVLPLQVSDASSSTPPPFSASNSSLSLSSPDGLRRRSQVSSKSATSYLQVHGSDAVSSVLPLSLPGVPATSNVIASSSSMSPISVPASFTCRVLIVEDNVFIRQLLARLLSQFGYESDWVENGRAAVERLAPLSDSDAKQNSPPFDLVLMDHLMPEMNGDEAIRLLRLRGFQKPIIGLTGNAAGAERDVLFVAGASCVLSKPVKADVLKQCLADALAL